jgi:hypothetical protein
MLACGILRESKNFLQCFNVRRNRATFFRGPRFSLIAFHYTAQIDSVGEMPDVPGLKAVIAPHAGHS